ncbi:PDR/VanB family oxidoreductase [Microbacterium sp. SORGH_AS_0888]|uniref:PDR/VanB family oxidoreductase n=1 Tax=Microbacterium sp. SORGH_AS_0888 TaxID=3041791 RepID=UPI0027D7B3FF|nr:PDR/VanB family oxidoreductase [Microbacterium sp. SORGH_AS_0888]
MIELEMEPLPGDVLPSWEPGAHIDVRLGDDMVRQYSLVPSPSGRKDTWTVAVLVEQEGRGGSLLIESDLHIGDSVMTSGPRNHFSFVEAESYLFIAGGIGITPLIAMCLAAEVSGSRWRLVYLGHERESMAYLEALEQEFPGKVEVYASSEGRRLDVYSAVAEGEPNQHVYCCGPERLMSAVENAMESMERLPFVHIEHFHPRDVETSENTEFVVHAVASDVEFVVPIDESILMAADFEGVIVPGDCLEGTCGSCETRVLSGAVEHRDSILSTEARRSSRTMMICVSRARPGCKRLELDL